MALKGIDVSEHQGVIDWQKVKASGVDFAILRAGYGRNNIDKQFRRNISECNRLGIPVGVYWFSYAYNHDMAVREAEYCMAACKGYKLAWPIFYDFEYASVDYAKRRCGVTATPALACDMALAFMQKVKAGGYVAGWYANPDYIRRYFTSSALNAYPLWIAQYASKYTYSGKAEVVIWQYADNGKVAGVNGNTDMNNGYKDYRKQEVKPVAEPWYIKDGTWAKAKELGLMDGKRPTENITRAEVAAVAVRLYKLIKEGKK